MQISVFLFINEKMLRSIDIFCMSAFAHILDLPLFLCQLPVLPLVTTMNTHCYIVTHAQTLMNIILMHDDSCMNTDEHNEHTLLHDDSCM